MRFYHSFPTDLAAPGWARRAGVRTPVLSEDGHDFAAALATIEEMGGGSALHDAISEAFPGCELHVNGERGWFALHPSVPGVHRPMTGLELSDGTLRFLCLAAALLSPRPPELLVLNEPETSLHPDVLPALAHLIGTSAEQTQVVVTTHSAELAEHLGRGGDVVTHELIRDDDGSTATHDTRGRP